LRLQRRRKRRNVARISYVRNVAPGEKGKATRAATPAPGSSYVKDFRDAEYLEGTR
jgi:hypothetical protein